MAPETYPTRGAWRFRNVTRSFDFWPMLESIGISQEHPEMTATFGCRVIDELDAYAFQNTDEIRVTFAGERIFAGHISNVGEDQLSEVGPKVWEISCQDYTAKASDALVRRRRKRKREKARKRVRWLLRQLERRVWTLASIDLSDIPDENVERYDYFGSTVAEALDHVAEELRLHWYIDLDNIFRMRRDESDTAPFDLDNEAPDYVTTFPFQGWRHDSDSVELANVILTEPEKRRHARWVKDATSIAAYGRAERFVSDSNLHKPAQAVATGNRTLRLSKDPEEEARMHVHEPGIWAGQSVNVREVLWDRDEPMFVRSVEVSGLDPHDENGEAYLVTDLTLTKGKRRKSRGRGSDHGPHNKNTRRRPGNVADTDPYVLDTFARVTDPPTWAAGSSLGSTATYEASKGVDKTGAAIAFSTGSAALQRAASYIGAGYEGHTVETCGCPGLDNCFLGWKDIERWYWLTVPTHPAGAAGVTVTINAGAGTGVAPSHGLRVVVLDHAPTDTWQGGEIAHIPASGSAEVFIPIGLVPAAGGQLHIGVQAGWRCSYGSTACGFVWPFTTGDGNSGTISCSLAVGPVWQTYVDAGGDFGSAAVVAAAPWEGGNAWHHAGTEGVPLYGLDGAAFYVTTDSPGGAGLYMLGEREDDDEPTGPWSDAAWSLSFTFEVDEVGDTGAPGTRTIVVTTNGEDEQTIGTIHLGDGTRAAGISVGGPTTTEYEAVSIPAGTRMAARFDSRSGKMRGKLWQASAGEPAAWNVQVAMEETEEDYDRWSLWIRAGNDDGSAQTVRVFRLRAAGPARSGDHVRRELIGRASGTEKRFATSHPFREGTLTLRVNGVDCSPASEDGDEAEATLDFWPTAGSIIRATYIAD